MTDTETCENHGAEGGEKKAADDAVVTPDDTTAPTQASPGRDRESEPVAAAVSGSGTGAGQAETAQTGIDAQDSVAINANLAGLAAGTIRLVG